VRSRLSIIAHHHHSNITLSLRIAQRAHILRIAACIARINIFISPHTASHAFSRLRVLYARSIKSDIGGVA